MATPRPTTVDFETYPIDGRPNYPPAPVGVSVKRWGKKARYYSWGHPSGNNCTRAAAVAALIAVWDGDLLFHHSKFDVDVAEVHMGLPLPPWQRTHDTLFLAYLDNPHARQLGLKPLGEGLLGMPPEEKDAVVEWLVANQPLSGVRMTRSPNGNNYAGKYIAYAPADVVGPYANGDSDRTEGLFRRLYPDVAARGMLDAYRREQRLQEVLLDIERQGIRVDLPRLRDDVATYSRAIEATETWVRKRLGLTHDPDEGVTGQALIRQLQSAGLVDMELLGVTLRDGKPATTNAAIERAVSDRLLSSVLRYRSQLHTCLATFMRPWLAVAERTSGLIFTNWHQVRGAEKNGTRTGRLSSTPNFQNMPKEFAALFKHEGDREDDPARRARLPALPTALRRVMPALPLCRSYIVPFEDGHVLVGRDYSQQEPRILAHFEDGSLLAQYQADPWIDFHDNNKENIERLFNRPLKRKPIKNIGLGIIYGQGAPSLAEKNGETLAQTKELRQAILKLYPGIDEMQKSMKALAACNMPYVTWGGREYTCEPSVLWQGKMLNFDYKMVNGIIQGSAADCTKEAIVRFYGLMVSQRFKGRWYLLLNVHDELVVSVPARDLTAAQMLLRQAMESVEFDLPIKSEGAWSPTDWASMADWDKKGVVLGTGRKLPPIETREYT